MAPKIPNVKFNNGKTFPIFGLGTWNSPPGVVTQAVKDAIDAGYRHIDCAHLYLNEHEVGAGIAEKFKEGVVKREDLFITSKLWNTFHRPDLVRPAFEVTLKNLGLKYVDLYLIHWPMGYKEDGDVFPFNDKGEIQYSDVDYVDTWKEMEKLVQAGLCKSIGVSNFNSQQIERVWNAATIKPVTNQVECHPYLNQAKLAETCSKYNIVLTAYSPLGSPERPGAKPDEPPRLLDDSTIAKIAAKYKKSAAQVLIRYQIERGIIVIPKSVTKSRIISNADIFDFKLTAGDMKELNALNCNGRFIPLSEVKTHKYFPFNGIDD